MGYSLSPEQAEKIRRLFDRIVEIEPENRNAFLDRECEDDVALREEVESLLAAFDERSIDMRAALANLPLVSQDPIYSLPEKKPVDTSGLTGQDVSHYRVQEKIGSGGMGEVYKALDKRLGRIVALKFLPMHLGTNDEAKQRFIREAKAASALDFTNICTIYEIDQMESGQLFIAMAYYDGETLDKKITRSKLSLDEALDYFTQMATGLLRAHEAGIIHRDIKPANVIITNRGEVKLVDFGLAKAAEQADLTKAGTTLGTIAYMSPEQASGDSVDVLTDIWSLGVVCYEMLAGERPFQGDYEQAVIYHILNTDPKEITSLNADAPVQLAGIINRCLKKKKEERYQSIVTLLIDIDRVKKQIHADADERDKKRVGQRNGYRIFISYKRSAEDDERVAKEIYATLQKNHEVFIDQSLVVGVHWVESIEYELARSDFLIVLLSADSIHSEMVLAEIETARRLALVQNGRPTILPVRLDYSEPFVYPLSAYLNAVNWAVWTCHDDTPRLIEGLLQAMSGTLPVPDAVDRPLVDRRHVSGSIPVPLAAAQPPALETPEGTMNPESAFYVERPADHVALRTIGQQGVTITVKGPRQMGKSSLLMRMLNAAAAIGKQIVFLDFQLFEYTALQHADTFFRQFCTWITDELDLENRVDEYWQRPLGSSQLCTRYVGRYLLKTIGMPVVLAMDEVERVFDTDFRSDFFGMLRSWHNDRAFRPHWRQLDLALITSTEPYQLIENLNQSPFNVGEVIDLGDFSTDEVADLNSRYRSPLSDPDLQQLYVLLGGHPYLTRKALYLLAGERITIGELLSTSIEESGPFGDHLRYHLFRLVGQEDLMEKFMRVLRSEKCDDEGIFWRLRGAGLVRRDGLKVVPRCRLYADYFKARLNG